MYRLALVLMLNVSCSEQPASLRVDLLSDYVSGVEATTVVVRLASDDSDGEERVFELRDESLTDGVRVAEFLELSAGSYMLNASLRRRSGVVLGERDVRVVVRGNTGVTVLITRSCEAIVCPDGDPSATECFGGQCVQPECTPENPDACPSSMCPDTPCVGGSECARARCLVGQCVLVPNDDECAATQYCDPDNGCTIRPGARVVSGCVQQGPVSPMRASRELVEPALRIDGLRLTTRQRFNTQIHESSRASFDAPFTNWGATQDGHVDFSYVAFDGAEFAAAAMDGPDPRFVVWCVAPFGPDDCMPISLFDADGQFTDDHDGPSVAVLDGELVMSVSRGDFIYFARPRTDDLLIWDARLIDTAAMLVDDPSLSDDGWLMALSSDGDIYVLDYDPGGDTYVNPRMIPGVQGGSPEIGVETATGFELFTMQDTRGINEPHRWNCSYE